MVSNILLWLLRRDKAKLLALFTLAKILAVDIAKIPTFIKATPMARAMRISVKD
jgi:hypothetical protein